MSRCSVKKVKARKFLGPVDGPSRRCTRRRSTRIYVSMKPTVSLLRGGGAGVLPCTSRLQRRRCVGRMRWCVPQTGRRREHADQGLSGPCVFCYNGSLRHPRGFVAMICCIDANVILRCRIVSESGQTRSRWS